MTTTNGSNVAQFAEMGLQEVIDRKRKILHVMKAVMVEGDHYGKIPGCGDKPTLFKSGAEVLATTFGLAPTFKITRTDLTNGHREYEIICTLTHIGTGKSMGEGVGTCSTHESKYRWRRGERKCPACGKSTIIRGKAEFGGGWLCFAKKGGCNSKWKDGAKEIEDQNTDRMENPDPADQYNTVLKMAKKRAQVDATLTAVGASDLLTQDLEDLPAGSDEITDAEFTDRPNGQQTQRQESRGPSLADRCRSTKSAEELKALVPELNKTPKNSDERVEAMTAYKEQLQSFEGAA